MKDKSSESEYICRAADGDIEAFRFLYEKYFISISSTVGRIVKDYHDTEDVVQDVFLTARSKLSDFQGNGSFEGWLRRIGINCALDFLKRRKRMMPTDGQELEVLLECEQDSDAVIENQLDDKAFQTAFQNALQTLPDEFNEVFLMAVLEKIPYEKIAETLSISRELVKVRVFRARKMLQETLKIFIK